MWLRAQREGAGREGAGGEGMWRVMCGSSGQCVGCGEGEQV